MAHPPEADDQSILVFSIPKGGTHLIELYQHYFSIGHFHGPYACIPHNEEWKLILNIRDLRDVIISFKNRSFPPVGWDYETWFSLTESEQITYFINDYKEVFNPLDQAIYFLETLENNPNALVVKFEDLVGPKGGGSLDAQKLEIRKIADYLGIKITEKEIDDIADKLFGRTITFKKGQIGQWKEEFTALQISQVKEKLDSLLIELGYESDFDW